MASYTQISLQEAEEILKLYGRSKVLKITPLSLGISNSNYRVDLEEGSVLLKISNDKNQLQLSEEQAILLYLNQKISNCEMTFSDPQNPEKKYGVRLVSDVKKENRLILSPSSEDAVLSAFGSDIQFYRESFGIIPNKNKYIYIKIIIFFLFCVILFYYFHKLY